jgi:hypothetical protein
MNRHFCNLKLDFCHPAKYPVTIQEETMKRYGILLLALLIVAGCVERKVRDPNGFKKEKIVAACDQIIDDFQAALKKELMTAMADGGPAAAIGVCNVKASMIADSFSSMPGIDIARVSLKQRNRQYLPDSFEIAALERFAADTAPEPQSYTEMVFDSAEVKHLRYMKEITVGQLCLNCHGNPEQFSPVLREALAAHYPDDPAVGYTVGDSRGAFSMTVRYPEAGEAVDNILSEQGK